MHFEKKRNKYEIFLKLKNLQNLIIEIINSLIKKKIYIKKIIIYYIIYIISLFKYN